MIISWTQAGAPRAAHWLTANDAPAPVRIIEADDRLTADAAYGLAAQGTALMWRGDFQNARQLLTAMDRRTDQRGGKSKRHETVASPAEAAQRFHHYRQARAQRARTLGALLIELDENYVSALRRAPDVRQACLEVFGPAQGASVLSLRALVGLIGAHEWRTRGLAVAALEARIHPHYGVFAPIRSEYLDLIAATPLPAAISSNGVAFDIGTGTGVLAAILARRGVARIIATDLDPKALECARENLERLGLDQQVELLQRDLYPDSRAALVVCNPPWLPARPSSPLERGIYDPDSTMLKGFLSALAAHLVPEGEGWLILSDLAEHLGLRSRSELLQAFEQAQLMVKDRHDIPARHLKSRDPDDPLHQARAAEITSLWRLARNSP